MDIHINIKESLDSLFHIHMFILCIKNQLFPAQETRIDRAVLPDEIYDRDMLVEGIETDDADGCLSCVSRTTSFPSASSVSIPSTSISLSYISSGRTLISMSVWVYIHMSLGGCWALLPHLLHICRCHGYFHPNSYGCIPTPTSI
jgi:hypothetical protein